MSTLVLLLCVLACGELSCCCTHGMEDFASPLRARQTRRQLSYIPGIPLRFLDTAMLVGLIRNLIHQSSLAVSTFALCHPVRASRSLFQQVDEPASNGTSPANRDFVCVGRIRLTL